ncbi:MAG TPA: hypothetical protein PLS12_07835 [Bacteroidales bacterium]|nr:hypothetical protein [Bacteroidales bacterium]
MVKVLLDGLYFVNPLSVPIQIVLLLSSIMVFIMPDAKRNSLFALFS